MIANSQIQKKLAEALCHSNITQTELSKMLKISQATISNYITGKRMPSVETLANICAVLELDANDILCLYK